MNKKVSVIIPCYNHGNFILETLTNILNSTYKNIEIVIVNDGSTDSNTNNILNSIKYDNVKVITTINQGTAGACKTAMQYVTGDYILPMGSDDKIDVTYIQKAVNILDINNKIGIVYCKAEFFGERTGLWNLPQFSIEQMKQGNCIFCSALFRKNDYDKTSGYNPNMKNWEDYDLWLSLLELGVEVYQIPEVLFYYRQTKKQKTNKVKNDKKRIELLQNQIRENHPNFFKINTIPSVQQPIKKRINNDKTFILF